VWYAAPGGIEPPAFQIAVQNAAEFIQELRVCEGGNLNEK
ncbi:hypothetical protein AVEN_246954-1, partial [Araneus ventricosus]